MLFERLATWWTMRRPAGLGGKGEGEAEAFLRRKGLRIVDRNWRCRAGEIDLIATDGPTLVFVEVKTRTRGDAVSPEEQVGPRKQHQVARAAAIYCQRFGNAPPPVRFDVVAVEWPTGGEPVIRHHVDAFSPSRRR